MDKKEKSVLILISIVLSLGILTDLIIFDALPKFMISRIEKFSQFILVIYQLQVTSATLGVSLLALISGISNKTIYGIPIAYYIMQLRPKILKHKRIIIGLLSISLVSYIFISFEMYNLAISMFFITIILIIFMSNEIFTVFQGEDQLKIEIEGYIEDNNEDIELLNLLSRDIANSIFRNESLRFNENMKMLTTIFQKNIDRLTENKKLKLKWEENLNKVFTAGFTQSRGSILKLTYSYFDQIYFKIYQLMYSKDSTSEDLNIWNRVLNDFIYGIRFFELEELDELSVFESIRSNIYKSHYKYINHEKIKRNSNSLGLIYNNIYSNILSNNDQVLRFGKNSIIDYKKYIYNDIRLDFSSENRKIISHIIAYELLEYTRLLVYNYEAEVLYKTFIHYLNRYEEIKIENELIAYNLSIIIYLYYLGYKEELIDKRLKEFAKSFFKKPGMKISTYLKSIEGLLNKSIIDMVRANLRSWEIMPEHGVKEMILEDKTNEFLIFYLAHTEKNSEYFKELISFILEANKISFPYSYEKQNRELIIKSYKGFIERVFSCEINYSTAEEDLYRLKEILFDVYMSSEIQNY